jgi:hypothetical protein
VNGLLLKYDGWKTVSPFRSHRTTGREQTPAGHCVTVEDVGRACQNPTAAHRHQPAAVEQAASALALATADWKSPHRADPVVGADPSQAYQVASHRPVAARRPAYPVQAPHQAGQAEAAAAGVAAWVAAVDVPHPALPAVAPSVAAVAAAEAYVSTRHAADKTADARNTVPSNPQH